MQTELAALTEGESAAFVQHRIENQFVSANLNALDAVSGAHVPSPEIFGALRAHGTLRATKERKSPH